MSEGAELVATTDIIREKGWLYYTSTSPNGCITLVRTPMAPSKRKKVVTQ